MTTIELKNYINKVLGNSIRCLLPSYWWKRLFNQVADRIDEAEQFASELVDASKMPIVEYESKLSQLDLPKGSVAAVKEVGESKTIKISDCYFSTNYEEDWEKYTIVKRVEEKANITIDKENTVWLSALKKGQSQDSFTVNMSDNGYYYVRVIDNVFMRTTLSIVNDALSSGNYRAIRGYGEPDQYFTFYSEIPRPELYIKGETWERLAKENDLEGIEGGSGSAEIKEEMDALKAEVDVLNEEVDALNEKSKVVRVYATIGKEGSLDNVLLTEEYKERNKEIYERVANDEVLFADIYGGYDYAEGQYYTGTRYFNALKGTLVGNRVVFRIENNGHNESSVTQIEIAAGGDAWIYHSLMADKAYVDEAVANAITNTLNTEV